MREIEILISRLLSLEVEVVLGLTAILCLAVTAGLVSYKVLKWTWWKVYSEGLEID